MLARSYPTPSRPYLYVPDGWNTQWLKALAAQATTPCWLTVIGDSIGTGRGGTDPEGFTTPSQGGWVQQVFRGTNGLLSRPGALNYAEYIHAYARNFTPLATWSGILNSLTDTGRPSTGWQRGYVINSGSTAVDHQTFTVPQSGVTSIDLIHVDRTAGTWQYAINAGAPVTVTNTGAGSSTAIIRRVNIARTWLNGDVLHVGNQSAAGVLSLDGAIMYKGSVGVGLGNLSAGSAAVADWLTTVSNEWPALRPTLFSGKNAQTNGITGTGYTGTFDFGFPMNPDLAIFALGVNDCYVTTTVANFQSGIQRILQGLRRSKNCSILFLIYAYPDSESSDFGILPPAAAPVITTSTGTLTSGSTYTYELAYSAVSGSGAGGYTVPGPASAGNTGSTGYTIALPTAPGVVQSVGIYQKKDAGAFALLKDLPYPWAGTFTDNGSLTPSGAVLSSDGSTLTNYTIWNQYADVFYQFARQWNCAVVNMHAKWMDNPVGGGYMNPGNIHPIDAGHADIANQILSII